MIIKKIFIIFFVFLGISQIDLCSQNNNLTNQEKILSFNSEIKINKDASIFISETITVLAKDNFRKGMYRDFPTTYYDDLGNRFVIDFQIIEILKNGKKVPFRIGNFSNGKRIYIGSKNSVLKPGMDVYIIKYKTIRQIGFFKNFDEFFWSINGNGWNLPIKEIFASVVLPKSLNANQIEFEGYIGKLDSKEKKKFDAFLKDNRITFHTTEELQPYETFIVDVVWQKGHVKEPNYLTKAYFFLNDNKNIFWFITFLTILLIYYLLVLIRTKIKDKEVIIPVYEAPNNLTPGQIRFIHKMEYDNKIFTSEILNMAVRGFLKIEYKGGLYKLIKNNEPNEDSYYYLIWKRLFNKKNELILNKDSFTALKHIVEIIKSNLEYSCKEKYFFSNISYILFGFLISFVAITPQILTSNITILPSIIILILINIIFSHLIKVYTKEGKKIETKIKGLKKFLSITYKERIKLGLAPELKPEIFEKLLPYAVALNVEEKFYKQFKPIFEKLETEGTHCIPTWYIGKNFRTFFISNISSSLNTLFSSIISSSSVPPGFFSDLKNQKESELEHGSGEL